MASPGRLTYCRSTTHSPITSTSILVRKKQSSASSGLHTTGSFSLKDVLMPGASTQYYDKVSTKFGAYTAADFASGGFRVVLTVRFRAFAQDGSSVETTAIGEGIDYGDKAYNKAMSVAHKYALLQLFCIPTEDQKDPENENHELKIEPPPIPTKTTIEDIRTQLSDALIKRIRAAKLGTDSVLRIWEENGGTVAGFATGLVKIEEAIARSVKGEVAP